MNLDNRETRDTREMLPGIGFTIEPGIYIPGAGGFGVRSEINVYVDPAKGPIVTSGIQRDPILV
jgi:Xaa-Pro aminopeptidase